LVLLVAFGMTLSACGGGSSGDSSTSSAETAELREPSEEFIGDGPNGELAKVGKESTAEEREAASRLIEESLRDREQKDWAGQCETLSAKYAKQVAEGAPEGLKTCAASVEAFASATKQSVLDSTMVEPIAALRINGTRAFAFYDGTGGRKYIIPLEKDTGEWRLAALSELELH
jgi:hypothetical protein